MKNVSNAQVDKTVARIVRFFSQYQIAYPAIVFVRHQASTEKAFHALSELFPHLRLSFTHGGQLPNWRSQIIQAFNRECIDVLFATSVLNTGVDVPILRSVVLANSTSSAILFKQSTGRASRLFEGKHQYTVYDLIDRAEACSFSTASTASARATYSREEGLSNSTANLFNSSGCSSARPMVQNNKEASQESSSLQTRKIKYIWSKDILLKEYSKESMLVLLILLLSFGLLAILAT